MLEMRNLMHRLWQRDSQRHNGQESGDVHASWVRRFGQITLANLAVSEYEAVTQGGY